jgi:hypothetical protein
MSVVIFGLLWLSIAAITIWGQNILTAACTLFLGQTTTNTKIDLRAILRAVKERSGDLAQASVAEIVNSIRSFSPAKFFKNRGVFDSALIIPALIQEKLSVDEASKRSVILTEQIRGKKAYPLFRRFLVLALSIGTWQAILINGGFILDGVTEKSWGMLSEAMWITTPLTLVVGILVLCFSLKSSVEQSVLYQAARQALGETPPDLTDARIRSGPEKNSECSPGKLMFPPALWCYWGLGCKVSDLIPGISSITIMSSARRLSTPVAFPSPFGRATVGTQLLRMFCDLHE